MRTGAAKSAPARTGPRRPLDGREVVPLATGDGTALSAVVSELVRLVREEARAAVREELAAERPGQTTPDADEWLTTGDVASRLGRSEKTIRHWIQVRGLPAQKHLGVWRVRRADLDSFITGSSQSPERSRAAAILAELHRP
jgi:excisionase family DNA binding protein